MKASFLKAMFAFVCIISCSIVFSACGGHPIPEDLIKATLPDKVHVEYGATCVYVKDGNDIFVSSQVYSMSGRGEVYLRENLSSAYITDSTYGDQMYATARWTGSAWETALDDQLQDNKWIANDQNHQAVYGFVNAKSGPATSGWMYYGYSEVNSDWMYDWASTTQLANQSILVGENNVECVVFEYVYEYGDTYTKSKYWFAADSGIYIMSKSIYDKTQDIDADGTENTKKATYYKTGETMASVLAAKGISSTPVF